MRGLFKHGIFVASLFLGIETLQAQTFLQEGENAVTPAVATVALPTEIAQPAEPKQNNQQIQKPNALFMPKTVAPILERPTIDGVARGYSSFNRIDEGGQEVDPAKDKAQIFLYYENFLVERTISGRITCNVRFVVSTNLDQKLISLAVKLVWPEISTNLSFINVTPNTSTYFDYTLMGNGCYSMDKFPNIIVNRCRVKGMSSSECAAKITWLKDAK